MQEVCQRIIAKWDEAAIPMHEMVRRTSLGESTLRRFRKGEKGTTIDTVVTIAQAIDMTADDIIDLLPTKTAVAVKMIEEEVSVNQVIAMQDRFHAEQKALYERTIKRLWVAVCAAVSLLVLVTALFVQTVA